LEGEASYATNEHHIINTEKKRKKRPKTEAEDFCRSAHRYFLVQESKTYLPPTRDSTVRL